MEIIEYFSTENKEYWLTKLGECEWDAGRMLHRRLSDGSMKQLIGEEAKILLLTDGDNLVSFCTLAPLDDIQPTDLTPWIGFVYTFPAYRGHRHVGKLIRHAEELAKAAGAEKTHISTNHIGLYEKYGYTYFQTMKDLHGEDSRVYIKYL